MPKKQRESLSSTRSDSKRKKNSLLNESKTVRKYALESDEQRNQNSRPDETNPKTNV